MTEKAGRGDPISAADDLKDMTEKAGRGGPISAADDLKLLAEKAVGGSKIPNGDKKHEKKPKVLTAQQKKERDD